MHYNILIVKRICLLGLVCSLNAGIMAIRAENPLTKRSLSRGTAMEMDIDSLQKEKLRENYITTLNALNEGLLDSAFALASDIYRNAQKINDSDYVAKATIVMGNISSRQQDYAASRKYYRIAEQYANKKTDKLRIAGNQALVLYMEEKYDIAADSFKTLAKQAEKDSLYDIAISFYINSGGAYTEAGLFDSAMSYFRKTRILTQKINDRKQELASLANMGAVFSNSNNNDSAFYYLKEAGKLALAIREQGQYAIITYNLSELFLRQGNFDSAYFYLSEYERFDSLIQQPLSAKQYRNYASTAKELAESRIRIAEQEVELQNKRFTITVICISSFCLVLLMAFLMTREHRKRSQQYALLKEAENRELKRELEYKQETDRLQREKIEQKTKELTSYSLLLANKNRLLKKLDGLLAEQNGKNWNECNRSARHEIKENMHSEEDYWNLFVKHFTSVDSAFLERLAQRFPSLNKNETRLCAYIRIGMTTKQIASMQNISPVSANQNRYLLRKRLGLQNGEDLDAFIRGL